MPLVLIIEDAPTNMQLAMAILKIAGHTAAFAFNAERGLEIARQEPIDLILMDMRLPGMDGLAATRALKDDPRTRDIPVIALTASAMDGDEQRMIEAGCCEYVAKPIRYRELLAVINTTMAKRRAVRSP